MKLPREPVGQGGANRPADARLVQWLLNGWLRPAGGTPLKVDGIVGPLTQRAINDFQGSLGRTVDGRIDPAGPSIRALFTAYFANLRATLPIYPPGSPGQPRVPAVTPDAVRADLMSMIAAAETYHGRRAPEPAKRPPSPGPRVA